ncbi:MAG TPA: thermonuclease family protein [Armatimonadetes bacterium]|nr:thermonuclease family protein [Armatimonadota bacterium]
MYIFRGIVRRIGDKRVTDGDTIRVELINPPVILKRVQHRGRVRLWGIDAPEMHYRGRTQGKLAHEAYEYLRSLLSNGDEVEIHTGVDAVDKHGRILGRVIKDGVDINLALLRNGYAVLYQIYPNLDHFDEYRAAFMEAMRERRGLFTNGDELELPFEFRMRVDGRLPHKYVADCETGWFYEPIEYPFVPVANRIFFFTRNDAVRCGYRYRRRAYIRVANRRLLQWVQTEYKRR